MKIEKTDIDGFNFKDCLKCILVSCSVPVASALMIAFLGFTFVDYFSDLIYPLFTPTKVVFLVMSFIVLILAGAAYYLFKLATHSKYSECKEYYYAQLFFTFFSSILVLGLDFKEISLLSIGLSIYLAIKTITYFFKDSKNSFYLYLPYCIWQIYIFYLVFEFWILNK